MLYSTPRPSNILGCPSPILQEALPDKTRHFSTYGGEQRVNKPSAPRLLEGDRGFLWPGRAHGQSLGERARPARSPLARNQGASICLYRRTLGLAGSPPKRAQRVPGAGSG